MKVVIVGGVAGGATAAARIRRLDEHAEITVFERSGYISYANCGLPYYIGDVITDPEELTLQTPESFFKRFHINMKIHHEVISVHPDRKTVSVKNLENGEIFEENYDKLILSPGAKPTQPRLPGVGIDKLFTLRTVEDACPNNSEHALPVIRKGKDGKPHMLYGMVSANTVAWVMYQKFCNSMPYFRQEKDWKQYGVSITRATMVNWVIRNSQAFFLPMYEYFHRKLLERKFAMADETPLQVLQEPGRRAQTKSYMWLFRSGEDGEAPVIIFKYSETRAGDTAVEFLQGFRGYLMCDGYSGYNKVPDAKRTACWAHIRRYLTDAIPKGKELDYSQPSVQGIMYINQLFHMEEVIKAKQTSFDAIKKARLEKEKPIVEGFLSWLDKQNPVRGSRMDKAVTYIKNRRSYLATYFEDGRCSFSNNLSENAIRPFTVGRNYAVSRIMFCSAV